MSDAILRSLRFREEREATWRRLEHLLARIERRSPASLSDEDLLAIPSLYRATLSSLSVARATSLDKALIDYLEALSARAYFFVYGPRTTLRESVVGFFARRWPGAAAGLWRETLLMAALALAGAVTAFLLVMHEGDWFYSFVPGDLAGGRTPDATAESLRNGLYQPPPKGSMLSFFATFLFTHNASIALLSFALGFALCLPTALLIVYNGATLGAMFAVYAKHGLALPFAGWVFIHGVTELFAIILAGAAGLRIGWAIAFPGARTRLDAAAHAGREGGAVMIGVLIMLMIAGLLEGVARQTVTSDWARAAIALFTLAMWLSYFYLPRRGAR
jgi:uncharacterized membrane protein SpoIIM required for sporulation